MPRSKCSHCFVWFWWRGQMELKCPHCNWSRFKVPSLDPGDRLRCLQSQEAHEDYHRGDVRFTRREKVEWAS